MAILHAKSGEPVDVHPLGDRFSAAKTSALIKTSHLEVIRLVLPAGKEMPAHKVDGEITVQCLEGRVEFRSESSTCELTECSLLFLGGGELHSLFAIEDSSLIVTILLKPMS